MLVVLKKYIIIFNKYITVLNGVFYICLEFKLYTKNGLFYPYRFKKSSIDFSHAKCGQSPFLTKTQKQVF